MNQNIEAPIFYRFIPARLIMERWKIDYIELRQLPLYAHIQTKEYDYLLLNPLSNYASGKRVHFDGLHKIYPFKKEDFEHAMYDFYLIVQYEYHHPDIVKDRSVCTQLEEDFRQYYPKIRSNQDKVTIPVPDGTLWEQIKIKYINDDIIQVLYPGGGGPLSSNSLGLANKPALLSLFKLFAKLKGTIKPNQVEQTIKANVSNLRNLLKNLFPGISGKPIKDYNKREGWECNFQIEYYEADSNSEHEPKDSELKKIIEDSQKSPAKSTYNQGSYE